MEIMTNQFGLCPTFCPFCKDRHIDVDLLQRGCPVALHSSWLVFLKLCAVFNYPTAKDGRLYFRLLPSRLAFKARENQCWLIHTQSMIFFSLLSRFLHVNHHNTLVFQAQTRTNVAILTTCRSQYIETGRLSLNIDLYKFTDALDNCRPKQSRSVDSKMVRKKKIPKACQFQKHKT